MTQRRLTTDAARARSTDASCACTASVLFPAHPVSRDKLSTMAASMAKALYSRFFFIQSFSSRPEDSLPLSGRLPGLFNNTITTYKNTAAILCGFPVLCAAFCKEHGVMLDRII